MGKNYKIKENFGQKQRNESDGVIIDILKANKVVL